MRNKTVADAYTPLHRVFMFDINEVMTQENLNKVSGVAMMECRVFIQDYGIHLWFGYTILC